MNRAIIICQNCGTTNNELNTRICRTCGALLPVSSRSKRRERSKSKKKPSDKKSSNQKKVQRTQSKPAQNSMDLHEIPKSDDVIKIPEEPKEIVDQNAESIEINPRINEPEQLSKELEKTGLQEITPKPFQSSILNHKQDFSRLSRNKYPISDAFSELKQSFLGPEKKNLNLKLYQT